jgi:hypothetical protein
MRARIGLILAIMGVLAVGPATAALATEPVVVPCATPDTLASEVLAAPELAASVDGLLQQLGAALEDVPREELDPLVVRLLTIDAAGVGSPQELLGQYHRMTLAELDALLNQIKADIDAGITELEQAHPDLVDAERAQLVRNATSGFVNAMMYATDQSACTPVEEEPEAPASEAPAPAPAPVATESAPPAQVGDATATASPAPAQTAVPVVNPSPTAAPSALARTGINSATLVGIVAVALGIGALLLAVTSRRRHG